MQGLLTIKETAEYLRISSSTIYKLVEKGKIPGSRIGGSWRFSRKVLDDWLNSQFLKSRGMVLIVDDDARVRNVLGDIIIEQGYQVVAVENGERAIEEVEKQRFVLVFLDLVLPGLSGVEVLRKLKARDKRAMVAIITGYGDYPIALEAMSLGPLLLIRKPFRVADIMQVINIVTKGRR